MSLKETEEEKHRQTHTNRERGKGHVETKAGTWEKELETLGMAKIARNH